MCVLNSCQVIQEIPELLVLRGSVVKVEDVHGERVRVREEVVDKKAQFFGEYAIDIKGASTKQEDGTSFIEKGDELAVEITNRGMRIVLLHDISKTQACNVEAPKDAKVFDSAKELAEHIWARFGSKHQVWLHTGMNGQSLDMLRQGKKVMLKEVTLSKLKQRGFVLSKKGLEANAAVAQTYAKRSLKRAPQGFGYGKVLKYRKHLAELAAAKAGSMPAGLKAMGVSSAFAYTKNKITQPVANRIAKYLGEPPAPAFVSDLR